MNKRELRNLQLKKLENITPLDYQQKCFHIEQNLFQLKEWRKSKVVAVTVSKHPEINTWNIIKRGWEEGKKMVVPKCIPEKKELLFYELTDFNQLENVYYGLYEPNPQYTAMVHNNLIDLMIVPGLAYTDKGYRLGFGGGYYDRLLVKFKGETLSLSFSEQIVNELPIESFDIPVQKLLTESEAINCER